MVITIYRLTVSYDVMGDLWVTFSETILHSKWIDVSYTHREKHKVKLQYFDQHEMCHPLPHDLMTSNDMQLRNDLIG